MRHIVLLLAVLLAAPALAGEPTAGDIRRAAQFSQFLHGMYGEAMAISRRLDDAETFIEEYRQGGMSEADFTAALDPWLDEQDAAVADYRRRYRRAPAPPSIGDARREASLGGFAEMVVGLGPMLDRQSRIVHRLRGAVLNGDNAAYDEASADSLGLAAEMVLAENAALEAASAAISPDHPQRGLNEAVIGGNEAVAIAVRVMEAVWRGQDFDSGAFALGVEKGLRRAERGIVDGERAARGLIGRLEGRRADSSRDIAEAEFIGELVRAYDRAFAIEREILDTERELLDWLRAVNAEGGPANGDDARVAVADVQAELETQTAQRMAEQATRLEMVRAFSETMATAPPD